MGVWCRAASCSSLSTWNHRVNSTWFASSKLCSICRGDCYAVAVTYHARRRRTSDERASVRWSWRSSRRMSWWNQPNCCGVFVWRGHTSPAAPPSDRSRSVLRVERRVPFVCVVNQSQWSGVKVSRNAPERRSGARKFKLGAFRLQNYLISQPVSRNVRSWD